MSVSFNEKNPGTGNGFLVSGNTRSWWLSEPKYTLSVRCSFQQAMLLEAMLNKNGCSTSHLNFSSNWDTLWLCLKKGKRCVCSRSETNIICNWQLLIVLGRFLKKDFRFLVFLKENHTYCSCLVLLESSIMHSSLHFQCTLLSNKQLSDSYN